MLAAVQLVVMLLADRGDYGIIRFRYRFDAASSRYCYHIGIAKPDAVSPRSIRGRAKSMHDSVSETRVYLRRTKLENISMDRIMSWPEYHVVGIFGVVIDPKESDRVQKANLASLNCGSRCGARLLYNTQHGLNQTSHRGKGLAN